MKRFITLAAAIVLSLPIWAQNNIDDILHRLDDFRIKAEFSCSIDNSDMRMDCKGSALAQGKCFVVKANGTEIYCDGTSLVIVDPAGKEVYIQDATGLESYLKENMGAVSGLKFQELRYLDKTGDMSPFRFDTGKLSSDWTVTDLR